MQGLRLWPRYRVSQLKSFDADSKSAVAAAAAAAAAASLAIPIISLIMNGGSQRVDRIRTIPVISTMSRFPSKSISTQLARRKYTALHNNDWRLHIIQIDDCDGRFSDGPWGVYVGQRIEGDMTMPAIVAFAIGII